jgi:hypothetical protein
MTNVELPAILCRKLSDFNGEELEFVRREFYKSVPCQLQQSWLPVSQQEFETGLVYTGWKDSNLIVFAELTDTEIFTSAKEPGDYLWRLGDTFEIFLGRRDQAAYYEFHVAPSNLKSQLHFQDSKAVEWVSRTQRFEDLMMEGDAFVSQTWVKPEIRRWFVLAEISGKLMEANGELAGAHWSISFCRYDYTRGKDLPVISSASPYTQADFHRRDEWRSICFE